MTTVIVDPATQVQLSKVNQMATLTDAHGHVLGQFIPAMDAAARQAAEPQISNEELERRFRQGGGRPLKDILRDLEKRG